MKDVARVAGVCVMTVSRALRNDPKISKETTRRVKSVSQKLGYKPDPRIAAAMTILRRRPDHCLGTVAIVRIMPTTVTGAPLLTERREVEGLRRRATEQGFSVDEFVWHPNRTTAASLGRIIWSRGIRGVALLVIGDPPPDIESLYTRFACATIDATLPALNHAHTDHFHGMSLAVDRLWARGYRRIAFYQLSRVRDWAAERWQAAFMYKLAARGAFDPSLLRIAEQFNSKDLVNWVRRVEPDVIISHIPALEIIAHLREANVRVPDDIGVATVEWIRDRPECAGVDQQSENVGSVVFDLISRQLAYNEHGTPAFATKVTIQAAWHDGPSIRAST